MNQAEKAAAGSFDPIWVDKVEELSRLCETANIRTHIAFLATAMLARSLNPNVNLNDFKPSHAPNKSTAYPARSLAQHVLVPVATKIGIHLGVTGREPLNNQPYFRMKRLDDGTPIRASSEPPFKFMRGLIDELQNMPSEDVAAALRAFIVVRQQYANQYTKFSGDISVTLEEFPGMISRFVAADSESGRRAQAVAAGLMDLVEGPDRVVAGRVNDPSRKHPGDVCITDADQPEVFLKAIEVRDKPVTTSDAIVFADKCQKHGVADVAILMVSPKQDSLDHSELTAWATSRGIAFRFFYGWEQIVREALFWSDLSMRPSVAAAALFIEARLSEVEVSTEGYELWKELVSAP
ncbi:hypothetical protein BBF93_16385 [Hyphomonas sp. CACIAM 19H1]|nr:hypothetical protein BBF93_16385 [Hyphomonas sp. CACIAM 19H1]